MDNFTIRYRLNEELLEEGVGISKNYDDTYYTPILSWGVLFVYYVYTLYVN